MSKYFKHGELQDKKIAAALRKAADDYENGEIAEVKDTLVEIINSITDFEQEYEGGKEDAMKKQIRDIIEDLGWRIIKRGDGMVELEQSSPAGEDFIFTVSEKNIVADIEEYAATFDPDEHVEMWSMAKRFGTSGVPTISELVEDAKAIEDMLEELSRRVADPDGYVKRYPTNWERLKELNHDAAGNLTHYLDSDGYEVWYDYDSNGNETHYRNSNGFESWSDYDAAGNLTHYRNSNGHETWCEYDAVGKLTHHRDSNGIEYWYINGRRVTREKWEEHYRKEKTIDGCPILSPEEVEGIKARMARSMFDNPVPFESYHISNNGAEIRRIKERIAQLEKVKEAGTQEHSEEEIGVEGLRVVENTEAMRIQLIFDYKPDEETRTLLKHWGFKWSPSFGAWQRILNGNGKYAAKMVIRKLKEEEAQ